MPFTIYIFVCIVFFGGLGCYFVGYYHGYFKGRQDTERKLPKPDRVERLEDELTRLRKIAMDASGRG